MEDYSSKGNEEDIFSVVSRENSLLSLLRKVRVNTHFPLISPVKNFLKSFMTSLAGKLLSRTTEKRDISSVNNIGFEHKPSDRSLSYNKKESGTKIDPWGTTVRTSGQDKVWPFRTTICLRFLRKLLRSSRRFLNILHWLSLKLKHHTTPYWTPLICQ